MHERCGSDAKRACGQALTWQADASAPLDRCGRCHLARGHRSLTKLNLDGNRLGKSGASALMTAVRKRNAGTMVEAVDNAARRV
jgi:hypothetical protein